MKPWMSWLWLLPACVSIVGCLGGLSSGDHDLIGKSLLVLAGTLSVVRIGSITTAPI
jgi:hypothetical protein